MATIVQLRVLRYKYTNCRKLERDITRHQQLGKSRDDEEAKNRENVRWIG